MSAHTRVLILAWVLCFTAALPLQAAQPKWPDLPEELKQAPGTRKRGEWLMATGLARIGDYRQDKARDAARKRSFLHAMQRIYLQAACPGLADKGGAGAFEVLAPLMPSSHLKGLSVIKQWEQDQAFLTAVAVPLAAAENLSCPVSSLQEAIAQSIKVQDLSLQGLEFCLANTSPYSQLGHGVRLQALNKHRLNKRPPLTLLLQHANNPELAGLLFWKELRQGYELALESAELADTGQWEQARQAARIALAHNPFASEACLTLSRYFLNHQNLPALALEYATQAHTGGSAYKQALKLQIECLQRLENPEVKVFQYLEQDGFWSGLSLTGGQAGLQLASYPVAAEILRGLGRIPLGLAQQPGPGYEEAVSQYSRAESDQDLEKVLQNLFQDLEDNPHVAETCNLIGACYRHLDKPALALPFLWQALNLRPDFDLALTNLGLCSNELGLSQAANFYIQHQAVQESSNTWVQEQYMKFMQSKS